MGKNDWKKDITLQQRSDDMQHNCIYIAINKTKKEENIEK